MTCRLLLVSESASRILDYFAQTRADCIEYAALWRFAGWSVWLEWGNF